jgi:LacI family transcriptional regulator
MSISIVEIAQRAGVSIATVSRALNGNEAVRESTKRRILQIAAELNYKPNLIARSLSKKKTQTIGVILPELGAEFFSELIHGIDEESYHTNNHLMVSSSHSQRNIVETLVEFMLSGRVDGLILMAPQINREITDLLMKNQRPLVLMNANQNLKNVISFNINNSQGVRSILEHLLKHGYRKIAIICGPEGNCDADERYHAYLDFLERNQIPVSRDFILQGDFTVRTGYYAFIRLMSQVEKPDAVFAANDMTAIGIYEAARALSLKIPDDIAVVGFDDILLSRMLQPRLTTVHVPIAELGSKAIRYLFRLINGEKKMDQPYREELSTGLVLGGSCGCTNTASPLLF